MRISTAVFTGFGLIMTGMIPAQVAAETKIYPYHGANYCPAGLQPVSVGGVICCGTPNQHISYQQALSHPTKKRRHVRKARARSHCPAGTKGCS